MDSTYDDFEPQMMLRSSAQTTDLELLISFVREQRPFQDQLTHLIDGLVMKIVFQQGVHDLAELEDVDASKQFTRGWYGHGAEEDSGGHLFLVDRDIESSLTITSIDTVTQRVAGQFEAHFTLHEESTHEYEFAEQVRFTEGSFCLTYTDQR